MKKSKTKIVKKSVLSMKDGDATKALRRVVILRDSGPQNPREDWDNVCTIYSDCRYLSSDKGALNPVVSYGNAPAKAKFYNGVCALPIYAYVHSGTTLSLKPFGDKWDSGVAGWIYVNKAAFCKGYGLKRFSPRRFRKVAEGEIAILQTTIDGNVFGYLVQTRESVKHIWEDGDSCWGYFGEDTIDEMCAGAGGDEAGTIICEDDEAYLGRDNVAMEVAV